VLSYRDSLGSVIPLDDATYVHSTAPMDKADRFKPLDEIAELIRSLTYGEMVEVASELQKAPAETKQIDRLAKLIRRLTYGEMLELASALGKAAGAREITAETLPAIFHRWASEHGK
jgi:hypothetical protein